MTIETLFNRALSLAQRSMVDAHKQRLAAAAAELSLAGHMQAHLDVATGAIVALINVLYQCDSDGRPANYDPHTGRILLRGLPWGDSGWRKWGLRKWEACCLRRLLLGRLKTRRPLPPLFDYNEFTRCWHINYQHYPDAEAALAWLQEDGPDLTEWRAIVDHYRAEATTRMQHKRSTAL